ncbi:MAG: TspO/MBR family protein [Acidobacteriaceae bacterium]
MGETTGAGLHLWQLAGWIVLSLAVGSLAGLLSRPSIRGWYVGLKKPSFNPPEWVFAPVWTALYILMGIAAWFVSSQPTSPQRTYALIWFLIQLGLNFLWSMMFFRWHAIAGALGEIAFLWLAILATMALFWAVRPLAGWLMVPYFCWVTFAAILNLGIFRFNRNR